MKRAVHRSLALACIVVCCAFAGCNRESDSDDPPTEPTGEETTASTESTADSQAFWLTPLTLPEMGEPPPGWHRMSAEEKRDYLTNLDVATTPQSATQVLLHGINDPELEIREIALERSEDLPAATEAAIIQSVLEDPVADLRRAALQQLKGIDGPEALPVLHQAMNSELKDVRSIAASQLTFRGNKPSLEILLQGLQDSDDELRESVHRDVEFLISKRFRSYDHAREWWLENRDSFDAELFENDP